MKTHKRILSTIHSHFCRYAVLCLIFSLLLLPFFASSALAEKIESKPDTDLLLINDKNLWGYIDRSGKIAIPVKYHSAYPFFNGMAKVSLNDKWGLIGKSGKEIVALKYDGIGNSFSEGMLRVCLNGKHGFVDTSGNEVVSLKYDRVYDFSYGLAMVFNEKLGWGVIDKSGKEIVSPKYHSAYSFSDGMAKVSLNGKWGLIDKSGKEVLPLIYDKIGSISDGLALVKLDGKYGFIDASGQESISLKYDGAADFSEGMATVAVNDDNYWITGSINNGKRWSFIDTSGKEVLLHNGSSFQNGVARIQTRLGYGYIDKSGNVIISPKYEHIEQFRGIFATDYDFIRFYQNNRFGMFDTSGKEVLPPVYSKLETLSEGMLCAKTRTKGVDSNWRLFNKSGQEIPLKYGDVDLEISAFHYGMAPIRIPEFNNAYNEYVYKWGVIDKTGKEVLVPLGYSEIEIFSEDLIKLFIKNSDVNSMAYYDLKTGKILCLPKDRSIWGVQ